MAKIPESLVLLPKDMNAVVVEKKSQQLFLYSSTDLGVQERLRFPCSTGAAPGLKLMSGDQKTPEGVYFLTEEYEDRYLSPVYGKKAFPTDYPNFIDQRVGRNGSAIWIHGTNKPLNPMESNGCVAMNNDDILSLAPYLLLGATPVVMVDTIAYAEPETIEEEKKGLLALAAAWKQAIESGTYHEYLMLYDSEYLPDIKWWNTWSSIRSKARKDNLNFLVFFDSPGIYREKEIYVIFFDMKLTVGNQTEIVGKRKFFVEKRDEGFKITGDMFQTFPKGEVRNIGMVADAANTLYEKSAVDSSLQDIQDTVDKWIVAWSAKDMKTYADSYSSRFFSDGMNKKSWVARKTRLARRYDFIRVSGKDFKITRQDGNSAVSFVQDYQASDYKEKGIKTLEMVNEEGRWKIFRESWKKN
ncbi:MAG: L,D-transpeptidase [Desulfobacterium sp.]|nr:L,D-transpeptidase [Desulfobacterium sp.]